jgi:hypothetical protein
MRTDLDALAERHYRLVDPAYAPEPVLVDCAGCGGEFCDGELNAAGLCRECDGTEEEG